MRALRPLRHRDFRLLWAGLAISLVGDGLWLVALAWQVIALGGGPVQLSLVSTLFAVGLVSCVLLGGVVADRFPRRRVMLLADVVRGTATLTLGPARRLTWVGVAGAGRGRRRPGPYLAGRQPA